MMDIDKTAVEGWARWKKGRGQLTALLTEIHPRTLDIVRTALAQHAGVSVADDLATGILFKDKRLVWPWGESLNIQYAIPAINSERLRVQFAGGRDELLFTVEARHGDDRLMTRATDELRASSEMLVARGFETGHWYGAYWARPHPISEWINASSIPDALIEFVECDVDFVGSGIFDALAELPETQSCGRCRSPSRLATLSAGHAVQSASALRDAEQRQRAAGHAEGEAGLPDVTSARCPRLEGAHGER